MKHFLSIQQLNQAELKHLISFAAQLKTERPQHRQYLAGQTWALLFAKSSTRTRVSFEVGLRELGGSPMFLSSADIQLGRGEPIQDTARVLGRMVHGAIIRTFAQQDVDDFAQYSGIPTINALTDHEHPCQIIADLLTIEQHLGQVGERHVVFLGDGDCNVARSWMWASAVLGFPLTIGAPPEFQPAAEFLATLPAGNPIRIVDQPDAAVAEADVLYTDVWVSMGKEAESAERLRLLSDWQVNDALLKQAKPSAIVMHCLPAYREKEIATNTLERFAHVIFDQAENRLHAQKAILIELVKAHQPQV